jgi:hypothetical protein
MHLRSNGQRHDELRIAGLLLWLGCLAIYFPPANQMSCLGEDSSGKSNEVQSRENSLAYLRSREDSLVQTAESSKVPDEMGRIYSEIARMYAAQVGRRFAEIGGVAAAKTITYSEKALGYPLDTIEALQVCVYWGDALAIILQNAPDSSVDSTAMAKPYLTGLQLIAGKRTLKQKSAPLPVNMFDVGGTPNDEAGRAASEERAKQLALRREIDIQNQLIDYRELMLRRCAEIYGKIAHGSSKLESDSRAASVVPDDVKEILRRMSTPNLHD